MLVAIGDIHGWYDPLQHLLIKLQEEGIDFNADTLVFLGDYVDGGPDSNRVIKTLMDLQHCYPHWVFLKGNHEQMLLDGSSNHRMANGTWWIWYSQGGMETLDSYRPWPAGAEPLDPATIIPQEHLDWMASRQFIHETESFIFVHAGLDPEIAVEENNTSTLVWIREPFVASTRDWGKRIIFGHTFTQEPIEMPNKIGIDTLGRGSGKLTAAILDDRDPSFVQFVE